MSRHCIVPILFFAIVMTSGCRDKEPPLVAIASPEDGSLVGDSVEVVIEVRDESEVYYTDLYIDDVYVDRIYGESGTYIWCTDSLQHWSEHRLHAEAVDMALNDTVSDVISVTVVHPGTIKWVCRSIDNIQACPAIGSDGTIYVVAAIPGNSMAVYLFAMNPDGMLKWQCHLGHPDYGQDPTPSIGPDGTIYVSGAHSSYPTVTYLVAIHPTGAPKWEVEGVEGCPAIGIDGAVYIGGDEGLHVYNPDGSLRWIYELPYPAYNPAIGSDGTIYFGCGDGYVYALDPDATLKWRYEVQLSKEIAIGFDNTIYFGAYDSYLYALSSDGTLKWRYYTGYYRLSPVLGCDGHVYTWSMVDGEGRCVALGPDGELAWSGLPGVWPSFGSAVAIAADSTIYFASDGLYALTPEHQAKWICHIGEWTTFPHAIGNDGTVYAAVRWWGLFAINGLAPLAKTQSAWPKVRHDEKNSGRGGF
jgi:outer membrane protein assembly factor BamB